MVAGPANPLSAGTRIHREGDEAVLRVTLDPGFEGLPGRAHGGIVASLFDEAMGQVLYMEGERGFTAWLRGRLPGAGAHRCRRLRSGPSDGSGTAASSWWRPS